MIWHRPTERSIHPQKHLDSDDMFMRTCPMAKRKFAPIVEETPPPSPTIRGRGASWSPANRFEKLHVDLSDVDVVQTDQDDEPPSADAATYGAAREPTRRETQFFRDGTKSI